MKKAESLVAALEATPLGEPWRAALDAATSAVASLRAGAVTTVFPTEIQPMSADTVALYAEFIRRPAPMRFGEEASGFHARAVSSHPELARAFRSREAIADVETAASQVAVPASHLEAHGVAVARTAAEARKRYEVAICVAIANVNRHELGDAARAVLEAEALIVRIDVARQRHEEHARAELARVEAERKAIARAVVDKTVALVRAAELAAHDAARVAVLSATEYRRLRAEALVERLRASGLKDLRVGSDKLFGVDDLIATAPAMSLERLAMYEAALARIEGAQC